MHVTPGDRPDHALVHSDAFDATVSVSGLAPELLATMLQGTSNMRAQWQPGIRVTATLADLPAGPPTDQSETIELDDGTVTLASDAAGSLEVGDRHRLGDTLLPQSLYLLLAQQWARAGLTTLHAAAFEYRDTGIVALGDQGAGKSVLTAAALSAGGRIVSDDWLLLGLDAFGRPRAERLREFLMLRHGEAFDRLRERLPALPSHALRSRGKSVIPIGDATPDLDRHFVQHAPIHAVWLLQRPDGNRRVETNRDSAASSNALAATVRAGMPLLMGKRFPAESARLQSTHRILLSAARCSRVETGFDLLDHPSDTLAALL